MLVAISGDDRRHDLKGFSFKIFQAEAVFVMNFQMPRDIELIMCLEFAPTSGGEISVMCFSQGENLYPNFHSRTNNKAARPEEISCRFCDWNLS